MGEGVVEWVGGEVEEPVGEIVLEGVPYEDPLGEVDEVSDAD